MKVLFLYSNARHEQERDFLEGRGHDNHFIGMFRLRKHGIETNYLEPEQYFSPRGAKLWRSILNIFWMHVPFYPVLRKYDIVLAGGAYGVLLVKALLRLKRPKWVIYDANIVGTITMDSSLRRRIFKWAVSHADGIVALSQAEEDDLRAMFPHLAKHIHFLYEGVDTNFFRPQEKPEGNFILSVGLDFARDFDILVEAVRDMPIELKLATKPSRVAHLEPLPPNVSARLYSHDEIQDLYARCKIAITTLKVPAHSNDSSGTYVVIEARASGKPVIVTKTKALVPYIRDGVDGVFVPLGDREALRSAITELLNDEKKRKELGRNAREFVLDHNDAEVYAAHLAEFMRRLHADAG